MPSHLVHYTYYFNPLLRQSYFFLPNQLKYMHIAERKSTNPNITPDSPRQIRIPIKHNLNQILQIGCSLFGYTSMLAFFLFFSKYPLLFCYLFSEDYVLFYYLVCLIALLGCNWCLKKQQIKNTKWFLSHCEHIKKLCWNLNKNVGSGIQLSEKNSNSIN